MNTPLKKQRIAICTNENNWHRRFHDAFVKLANTDRVSFKLINIDAHDWIEQLEPFDIVLWKPHYMGIEACSYFKEKVYFIENHLKKRAIPNLSTVWHFESKIAQSYLFKHAGIPSPKTCVSFDVSDALEQLDNYAFPAVFKESFGASSSNVRLVRTKERARSVVKARLGRQLIKGCATLAEKLRPSHLKPALNYLADVKLRKTNQRAIYWQAFVKNNSRDLRISVVGGEFAFAFWRNNRPNDFRASGGGALDYDSPVPIEAIRYCMDLSRRMNFDSMAYDLLFDENGDFTVCEISYGYVDSAIYNTPGHYRRVGDSLEYVKGHRWPQELWVRWLLQTIDALKEP